MMTLFWENESDLLKLLKRVPVEVNVFRRDRSVSIGATAVTRKMSSSHHPKQKP